MSIHVIKVLKIYVSQFLAKFPASHVTTSEEPYVRFLITTPFYSAKIYDNNKKDYYKVVFNGESFPSFLQDYEAISLTKEERKTAQKISIYPQIGSDEVGFGDFFGPLVVVAALVRNEDISLLETYRIKDSKKITDDYILTIGPLLAQKIAHVKNIVSNDKYNDVIKKGYNMNQMKAMLHVNVLQKLSKEHKGVPLYFDEFTSEEKFLLYTKMMNGPKVFPVTNGEENALSIATASVLARYYFLSAFAELEKRFGETIPKGASKAVDSFALRFIKTKGINNFKTITKHNFRNFKDLAAIYPALFENAKEEAH